MADFEYLAIDPQGRERRGRARGSDAPAVSAQLARRQWHVVKIAPAESRPAAAVGEIGRLAWRRPRLSARQLTMFTRQLASLMRVSPIEEALRTISRQSENARVRAILGTVHAGVVEGQPVAEAMRREPASFPAVYRAMISAGESSGSLPDIAERLGDQLERQAEVRGKLLSALAYPIVLSLVALAVVVGLMVSVVPRVVEQFDDSSRQLPLLTRIVIVLSEFLAGWWWAIAIALVIAAVAGWRALKVPALRLRFDGMLLRLPLVGRLIRDVHAASLARTLSTMIASRLPLLDGLQLTSRTVHNTVLRRALEDIVERIRGGGSLSGALRTAGHFPPLLVYLAASGEAAGQLGPMLERAADYLEREFQNFTATAMSMLEPAIIVVMGGMVTVIILAILLPILQLQTLAGV